MGNEPPLRDLLRWGDRRLPVLPLDFALCARVVFAAGCPNRVPQRAFSRDSHSQAGRH